MKFPCTPLRQRYHIFFSTFHIAEGELPLGYAVRRNSVPTVSLLLNDDGLEQIRSTDKNGKTVIQTAGSVVMQNFLTEVRMRSAKIPRKKWTIPQQR